MGGSSKQHAGYRFFLDMLMGFSRGACDEFRKIRIGGRDAWEGSLTDNGIIRIDKPDLFGGIDGAGGVVGDLHVQMGGPTQARHSLIVAALGPLTSALRGVCTGWFTGQIAAINPYPEPWEVLRTTILKGWDGPVWYPEKATVVPEGLSVPAMNAAHILIKVLTHRDAGRGLPLTRIDLASYAAAADIMHAEGLGLCLRWNRQVSVNEFLQQVADHISASQYISRTTGLLTLSLARGGYEPHALPIYDYESGLLDIEEDDNPTAWGATNEIIVEWRDPVSGDVRTTRWQNLAAIQAYGKVSETVQYPGIPTAALAARLAQRDGAIRSSGAKRFNLTFDRRGYEIEPAGLFRIRAPEQGIAEIVLRAGDIRDGTLVDGRIRIVAIQDVFALDAAAYLIEQPTTHVAPDRTPMAVSVRQLAELSYRDLAMRLSPAALDAAAPESSSLMALARRPSGLSLNYHLFTRTAANAFEQVATGAWCPNATLVDVLPRAAGPETVSIAGSVDLQDVEVGEAALVGSELVRVDAIDLVAGTMTIGRGCVDTVPGEHAAGTRVWFVDSGATIDPTEYVDGETVDAKLQTRTTGGLLDVALAPTDAIEIDARPARPYPPADLKVGGLRYPAELYGPLTATWVHRDRLLQADQLVDTRAVSIGPEPGTTYTIRWYLDLVLVRTQSGLAGMTDAYTPPVGSGGKTIRVEVESWRDGLRCWQVASHTFLYRAQLVTEAGDRVVTEAGDPIILE